MTGSGHGRMASVSAFTSSPMSTCVCTRLCSRIVGQTSRGSLAAVEALDSLESARGLVARAERVVVLTGAGISTDSGIPDFRGPQGVWTKNPEAEKTATLQYYVSDPEVRKRAWRNRVESPMWHAEPNAGHRALSDLERKAALHTLVTQNIDGLHLKAG